MVATWMLYLLAVSLLVGLAALAGEKALLVLDRSVRWVWAAALGIVGLFAVAPFLPDWVPADGGGAGGTSTDGAMPFLPVPGGGSTIPVAGDALPAVLDAILVGLWVGASGAMLLIAAVATVRLCRERVRWEEARVDGIPVLVSRDTGPAVFGVLRTRVVIPRWVVRKEADVRRLVLAHEREHVRARDATVLTAAWAVFLVLSWNPVMWWLLHRLRVAVELDCDRRVVHAHPAERNRYGHLLVEMARRGRPLALPSPAFSELTSSLDRRIEMLVHEPPHHPFVRASGLALIGLLLITAACLAPPPEEAGARGDPTAPSPAMESAETARDLSAEPQFTPYTREPEIRNRGELAAVLEREYPATLRDAGIGGQVLMYFFITERGAVENVVVAEPSGHRDLDEAALRVAQRFEFTPAENRGERVPVWIQVPIRFETN